MKEKIILKVFGEKKALELFGIRPKKKILPDVRLSMNGLLLKYMTTQLNKQI